jgi:hypothetical protein
VHETLKGKVFQLILFPPWKSAKSRGSGKHLSVNSENPQKEA